MNSVVRFVYFSIVIVGQSLCQENIVCGKLKYRLETIVNGIDNMIPWAAILIENKANLSIEKEIVPGILVSRSLVFISARYFYNDNLSSLQVSKLDSHYTVMLGSPGFSNDTSQGQRIPVSFISVHPKFTRIKTWKRTTHDFALAHLKYPVQLSEEVQPVCVPSFDDNFGMENLGDFNPFFVFGWSRTYTLHYKSIRIEALNRTRCNAVWKEKGTPGHRDHFYCAVVSQMNDEDYCPKKGVGTFYSRNGSYFFGGHVWKIFRDKGNCEINTPIFVSRLTNETLQWIENSKKCGPEFFTCFEDGKCIPITKLCDGRKDCVDSTDEQAQYCQNPVECTKDESKCELYGNCFPNGEDRNLHCVSGKDGTIDDEAGEGFGNLLVAVILTSVVIVGLTITGLSYFFYFKMQHLKERIRNLTKEEIEEFRKGSYQPQTANFTKHSGEDDDYCQQYINRSILANSWKAEHEIPMDRVKIGMELNCGNFGVVYKGQLRSLESTDKSTEKRLEVAVKTYASAVTVDEFKNFLREIKILAHVGAHKHIVSFLGACTGSIKRRRLYLLLELCELGDLRNFLRSHSQTFSERNLKLDGVKMEGIEPRSMNLSVHQLIKWSSQIASGMEYLETKNVIHGDLASRNVLLNKELDAKISDFGLARELNDSEIYVKSPRQILLWRLLALESFTKRIYSHKTDVWAYGVTLWEIFSLGEVPYGETCFNSDFVMRLQRGDRLPCPPLASEELYDVLLKTWSEDSDSRPTFKDLQITMSTIESNIYANVV